MITTRYIWKLDITGKVLSNRYGSILRDGLVWHFRGRYFDDVWTRLLGRHPMRGSRSLQEAVRMVEYRIARYRMMARHLLFLRAVGIAGYTLVLVAIPTAIIFAWAKSSGY